MTTVYSILKKGALAYLPEQILSPLRAWHYERVLRSFSEVEEPDLTVVRQLVEPGSVVFDIGANIGVYTKTLSQRVGAAGGVVSIEPMPQTFAVLSRNVRSLGLTNVHCLNVAISDRSGEAFMEVPESTTGGSNFYQARLIDGKQQPAGKTTARVSTTTLDAVVRDIGRVEFVKVDVEGFELACLLGAQSVLATHCPAWLVEVSGDPDVRLSNAWKTFRRFEDHAYVPWWFDGTRLRQRKTGDRSTNYFFLRAAHSAKLRTKAPSLFA